MKTESKNKIVYWAAVAVMAIGGALLVLVIPGCAVMRTGGYWESPPLNRIEVHAIIIPPPVARNLYDMMNKESYRDRAGNGFIRYDIIGTPQCQLNRKVQIDVAGQERQTLSCDIGGIFTQYYLPIKRPTRISFKLLGPRNELIEEKSVTITPDSKMISDYGGTEYGWRIIVTLSRQGSMRLDVSDPNWKEPRY